MVPKPDVPSANERIRMRRQRAVQRELFERIISRFPNLRDHLKRGGDGVPVDPRRPNCLSGGAAAALDFEEPARPPQQPRAR